VSEPLAKFPEGIAEAERVYIDAWRQKTERSDQRPTTGLALSGGGIRSAVFCLGVLQALAKHNVLKNFDYLSTVSGGGYIGSSLTWFTRSTTAFGVERNNIPYGIDDPMQSPLKDPPGTPLLPHLRRHGSYLDPGGTLSLLAGAAVVLRGIILNLFVIWLPIATFSFVLLRVAYRLTAYATANNKTVWFHPFVAAAAVAGLFAFLSVVYSLYSGWRQDLTYAFRQRFEQITPYILKMLMATLVIGSLPYVRDLLAHMYVSEGAVGLAMSLGGSALGLWSRLVPKGDSADSTPGWAGPVGAALVLYGIGLLAFGLSGFVLVNNSAMPATTPSAIIAGIAVFAVAVGYFVDLNETTLHRFYRDRLMEAFMPDLAPTGYPINKSARAADASRLHQMCDPENPKAPYHLINGLFVLTAINKDGVDPRWLDRWRIRGGDNFLFSPRYCGSDAVGWYKTEATKAFSDLSLPTAMAVSGAAVNPDAASAGFGPQRNMLFAMLMALLNLRLGIWLPNPRRYHGRSTAPAPNHFNAGLSGVLDCSTQTGRFLEIADGGNFDNLGLYELLRRGVQTIVLCDATGDAGSAFKDLQTLLSLAEADFGVVIDFTPPPLGPLMPSRADARFPLGVAFAEQPYIIGQIHYPNGENGRIYLIKPVMFAGLRLHVLGFKAASPDFPNDSTVDQFFDEARFEAYRELGFACANRMLSDPDAFGVLTRM
jgi:Patatin-like phospholipase